MSEMIERIAKQIFERLDEYTSCPPELAETLARIAIGAMREPTDAMIDAGQIGGEISSGHVKDVWSDMIDAALNSS